MELTEFIRYLWKVKDLRTITESAPEKVFAEQGDAEIRNRLRKSIDESLQHQSTKRLAIVAHDGCKKNLVSHEDQMVMLRKSVDYLTAQYPDAKVAGIWIDRTGTPFKVEL
ncbi:MAG: hypothetical protein NTU83_05865 [Candidatus Hydrogenedentes bacterium]|nr:hypothetical protein [Candidatus Hydrogenedentota bacterium]